MFSYGTMCSFEVKKARLNATNYALLKWNKLIQSNNLTLNKKERGKNRSAQSDDTLESFNPHFSLIEAATFVYFSGHSI